MNPRYALLALALAAAPAAAQDSAFVRGDSNTDGSIDISDPVKTLGVLFLGDPDPGCDDAMDSNDSGVLDISDGVFTLNFLFAGGADIPAPYPDCGKDTTADGLGCGAFPGCPSESCFDEALLDEIVAENVMPAVCVAVDAAQVTFQTFRITVCPSAAAGTCSGEPGCTIELTQIAATYDAPTKQVRVHVEGRTTDFPVKVEDTIFGSSVTCLADATFEGDATVILTIDGTGTITAVGDPVFSNVNPELLDAGDGLICNALEGQAALVEEQLVTLIEESADGILDTVKPALIGLKVCAP